MTTLRGLHLANVLAVPGTGHGRRRYRGVRYPRNIGVRRALLAHVGTLRGVCTPPDDNEDISRSCERSWKRHRLTRWRETA